MTQKILLLLPLLALLALPAAAGPVTISLTSPHQAGTPGSLLTFDATVTNTADYEVFLNGDSFGNDDPLGSALPIDDFGLAGVPFSLAVGEHWTGTLFAFTMPSDATLYSRYAGYFTLTGGADGGTFETLDTAHFTATAVPEPGSMSLLLGAAGLALAMRRRSRRV